MSTAAAFQPADARRYLRPAAGVGLVALIVCVIGGFFSPTQFFRAYLSAYLFFLGLGLGSMVILMIWRLTGGAWGFLSRRVLEAAMRTLPLLAVLFVPIACGVGFLYLWAQPAAVAASGKMRHQQVYLNVPFFWGRAAVFFACWLTIAYLLNAWSDREERTGDPDLRYRISQLSGIGLVVYGITLHFASIDWVMSLQPVFHSTIFGPLLAMGQLLPAQAFAVLLLSRLVTRPPLDAVVSAKVMNDLGNLLLSFLVLWAYMVWFQFMLIWIANLPVDVIWYLPRSEGGWQWLAYVILVFNFAIPFFLLLVRRVKQAPQVIGAIAGTILVMQLAYDYYLVEPPFEGTTIADHWMDFLTPFALGGLWLAYFLWQFSRRPLVAENDHNEAQAIHLRRLDEEDEALEEMLAHG
jgi:hypothetical protein